MSKLTLEQQVDRLASIEAIKQLKARYCMYCDDNYNPDGICGLFVEDGIWDGGESFGRHVGVGEIRKFFEGISGDIVFAAHLVLNPIITVDGDSANAKWWLLMPCTVMNEAGDPEGRWLLSEYDDEHVRVDGEWKFKHLKLDVKYFVPHLEDWARESIKASA